LAFAVGDSYVRIAWGPMTIVWVGCVWSHGDDVITEDSPHVVTRLAGDSSEDIYLHVKCPLLLSKLNVKLCPQILEKLPKIKFYENLFSGSPVVTF
jgi:hypothetical protein